MIRKSLAGVSPNLTVVIGGAPANYDSIMAVTLLLEENKHDMCTVTMSGVPSRFITEYIGQSIYVKMETGSTFVSEFYGTIERTAPAYEVAKGTVNSNLFQTVDFTCFGTSYAMRGSTTKVWSGLLLSDVATKLADEYGYSLDVPSDPLIFDQVVQSTESDWQFLTRYCTMMGYSLNIHGTHMHIYDPFEAKGRLTSLHRFSTPVATTPLPEPGQILTFDGSFAQRSSDGNYFDAIVTVHTDNGSFYDLKTSDFTGGSGARFANRLDVSAYSYAQAERVLRAAYRAEYDYRAEVKALGACGIVPGGIVDIDKYDAAYDGLWYVASVKYELRTGLFTSSASLRKGNVDTLSNSTTTLFRPPPPPQYINGWTTTQRSVNVYT